ncbi:N-(5'-phosphoribosyl)anthranilate isomerase [Marichromatium purpuratum 984]|uniref:N-(5'-phosphoribosyl)anthranilate isomerase n=1 Tax=Marichromatium purpuratum 984 TaxID=765910 RepID=W0DYR8_MARPU|nr:N-(5'-phosphoribosyl)anthranilate isomerase [Marichromatium purpuratum 984]
MIRTRVKICGLTCAADIDAVSVAGADAVGLVFHPDSPRAVSIAQARALCERLPPFVTAVGLFVDADPERVRETLRQVPLELLQFHGEEPPEYCAAFARRWIKAVRMRPGILLEAVRARYAGAAGLLLDTYRAGVAGGTGERFDWARIPQALRGEIVLAGGLAPDNVAAAIAAVRPFGVDVSGGVEASKGVKDHAKISAFMTGVRDGDRCR